MLQLSWCDAQDVIQPSSLPPVVDATYPSRPDTVSGVPLPLDSVLRARMTDCTGRDLQ